MTGQALNVRFGVCLAENLAENLFGAHSISIFECTYEGGGIKTGFGWG